MPKLWLDTIDAHRREVRRAILDTTATLVAEHGVTAVTMSQIAEQTGIGRATLYKYFSDVEAILDAWHEDHVARHLERLAQVRDRYARPGDRLAAVLNAYAEIILERSRQHDRAQDHPRPGRHDHAPGHGRGHAHGRHGSDVALLVHRSGHVEGAQRRLTSFLRDVLTEARKADHVRSDIASEELATYCLHALAGAGALRTRAEVARLVDLTISGLRPPKPRRARSART
jgi:AcrR family transcriptional regulator